MLAVVPIASPLTLFRRLPSAVQREDGKALTLFAVNRSLDEAMPIEIVAEGFGRLRLREARQLHHPDLNAVNTRDDPDQVKPVPLGGVQFKAEGRIQTTLTPASWNMLRFEAAS